MELQCGLLPSPFPPFTVCACSWFAGFRWGRVGGVHVPVRASCLACCDAGTAPPTPPWLCWKEGEQVAVAVLFTLQRLPCCLLLLLCLPCGACSATCCFCMTAGQDAASNAIVLGVASRRRFCSASPHPAAHGLLSLIRLLRAIIFNVIKRNHNQEEA